MAETQKATTMKGKEKESIWGVEIPHADTWLSATHVIGYWNLETASNHLRALVKIGHTTAKIVDSNGVKYTIAGAYSATK